MDDVGAKLDGVAALFAAQVIAKLVLFLVAIGGEERDGRGELIVAVGLKAGDGGRG